MELLIIKESGKGFNAGDIIDARPDGFAWGRQELTHPMFRIVYIHDLAVGASRDELLAPVVDENAPDGVDPVIHGFSHRVAPDGIMRMEIDRGRLVEVYASAMAPVDIPSEKDRRKE